MIQEAARQAFSNLMASKMRSFLAVLGILVGTASVVTLVSSGQAATAKALAEFKSLGTNVVELRLNDLRSPDNEKVETTPIQYDDLMKLAELNPQIETIAPYDYLFNDLNFQGVAIDAGVLAATDGLATILKLQIQSGHFVSFVDTSERYCVIGGVLAKAMQKMSTGPLVGKQIRIGSEVYSIIGVLKAAEQNPFFYGDINQSVIIPVRGIELLNQNRGIHSVLMTMKPGSDFKVLAKNVTAYFAKIAPKQKVLIRSPQTMIDKMESQNRIFTLLLGLIGSISLLVGGIGVMNVMLVCVTERRSEIGLRKALGATKKDIQQLFIIESLALALFGGGLGVLSGMTLSWIIAYFADWGIHVYLMPIIIGFIVAAVTGVFFGSYPAIIAARLNPIEALRHA